MLTGEKTDMHLHTWYSDGKMSPEEVVRYAKNKGLNKISVTDHDGVSGIQEALEAGRKYNIEVIPGIELSAAADGKGVHILGYFIDYENKDLNRACHRASQLCCCTTGNTAIVFRVRYHLITHTICAAS